MSARDDVIHFQGAREILPGLDGFDDIDRHRTACGENAHTLPFVARVEHGVTCGRCVRTHRYRDAAADQ